MKDSWMFVLSHDELSLAEVVSYLEAMGKSLSIVARSENMVVISISSSDGVGPGFVKDLGGTLKVGEVSSSMREEDASSYKKLKVELDSSFICPDLDDKANWGVSVYGLMGEGADSFRSSVEGYFNDRLKREGVRKAKVVRPKRDSASPEELLSYDVEKLGMLETGMEVLAGFADGFCYLGRSVGIIDNDGFHGRDFGRPVQKSEISIPPKLARILVNLVGAKPGRVLLDPFCGIGTILQEGLVRGANVIGSDIDPWCVSACKKNLDWFSQSARLKGSDWKVLRGDARNITEHLGRDSVNCIATEPILVPPLNEAPSKERALEMAEESGRVYVDAIKEMTRVVKRKGRIAIVQPYIMTKEGGVVSFQMEEMAKAVSLRPYYPTLTRVKWRYPLMVAGKKGQTVLRAIHVLEKP